MSSEYTKIFYTSENTDLDDIKYYMPIENKKKDFADYALSQDIINSPIYQEIHNDYNHLSSSLNTFDIQNNKYNSQTKSENINFYDPKIIDCEITMEDDSYTNKKLNYIKFHQQKINPINAKYNPLNIVNKNLNQYRARSPNNLRKINYVLNHKNCKIVNNDLIFKSNSISKFSARNRCSSPRNRKIIMNNNFQILKDSYSANNIHPMRTIQYQYKVNTNKNQIKKLSTSQKNKQNNALFNLKNKIKTNNSGNINSYSTMISQSQKSIGYNNNLSSKKISPFNNNFIIGNNDNDSNNLNSNTNIQNYQYLVSNSFHNNFRTNLNSNTNNNYINHPNINSEFNSFVKNSDSLGKLNDILKYSSSILYKPKFQGNNENDGNYKIMLNKNEYNPKILLSHSPKRVKGIMNMNNHASINSKESLYQDYFIKTLSPRNNQYKEENSCFQKHIPYSNSIIKSSLSKISKFSNKNVKTKLYYNNINDITFGANFNSNKNIKNFGKKLFHKSIPSENNITSSKNRFNLNNSKKQNNYFNEDDIPYIEKSRNKENIRFTYNNNFKEHISLKELTVDSIPGDFFSRYIFDSINKLRENPQSFIKTLKSSINNITYDKEGKLYYNGKIKVALFKGKIAFEEAILFLKKVNHMEPLKFKKELCVEIPKKEKYFKSGDYLRRKINNIIMKGISVRAFWKDIIKDPQINFILMVVDDNYIRSGAKRKDILNPNMKYIGINAGYMDNSFVCFTVLSDE